MRAGRVWSGGGEQPASELGRSSSESLQYALLGVCIRRLDLNSIMMVRLGSCSDSYTIDSLIRPFKDKLLFVFFFFTSKSLFGWTENTLFLSDLVFNLLFYLDFLLNYKLFLRVQPVIWFSTCTEFWNLIMFQFEIVIIFSSPNKVTALL